MAYTKQTFIDKVTNLKAEHLNHIEDGIVANETAIGKKQDALVSGTNIKTINGQSILGEGDIEISGGGFVIEGETTGDATEQIVKVDKTSVSATSNDTEHNLASGTAGVSTGLIDNSNPYFNSNVYLPEGVYIELPEGAYQLERYYGNTSGVAPNNIKVSFFNADKLVVTASDHSGIPDATTTNSTTEEGYISTIISVPDNAKYFSYQIGTNTDLLKIHKIIVYCKQTISSSESVSISVKEIDNSLDSVDIIPPYEDRVDGYTLDLTTGEPTAKTSYTYLNKYFELADGAKYLFTTYLVGQVKDWSGFVVPFIYYYDADKAFISSDQFSFDAESPAYYKGISGSMSDIPEGAKYFRYSASIYTYNVVRFAVLIGEKRKLVDSTSFYLGDNKTSNPLWKKQIVCFGDSITGSYVEADDSFKSYEAFLEEMTGATVHNVGFGGCLLTDRNSQYWGAFSMTAIVDAIVAEDFSAQQTALELIETDAQTSGYALDFYKEHVANLQSIDWTTVDYATIFYGTNDWASGIAIEPSGDDEFDRTSIKGAYRYVVQQLLTKYPHLQITLLSVIPRFQAPTQNDDFTYSFEYMADVNGVSLEDYRNATEEMAKELHTGFIDMYNCGINKYNATLYFANNKDGTHPVSYGRELIARRIAGYLTARF